MFEFSQGTLNGLTKRIKWKMLECNREFCVCVCVCVCARVCANQYQIHVNNKLNEHLFWNTYNMSSEHW